MNKTLKQLLPDVLAVVIFALLAFAYFYPADTEGRILYQHDTSASVGAGQESAEYLQRTGERTRWTNALFSGMPTYQLAPSYDSTRLLGTAVKAYHLWLPDNVWFVFAYLLGFYILLRAFNFKQHLAALGSIVWAFSTYFLIIIAAGHLWKVMALAYLPPMIAGIVLAFRGKYLSGMAVTGIFAAMEISANHWQMTYYYMFIIALMVVAFAVDALRRKAWAHLAKATAACLVGGVLGVLVNVSNLYHTWEYSQQTMRGGTELSKGDGQTSTSGGLDREYITQWSYGIGETWTLLVPNAVGGSHNEQLKDYSSAMDASDPQLAEFCGQWYPYWGDQPFTAGPVYVGAFVLMLFVVGLYVVKGPLKWALVAATVLSILLSWGHHFMGFTDFFIDHMPLYSKFRTVSSILVIAEFTIPLLAMLALKRIVEEPRLLVRPVGMTALGSTAGALLIVAGIAAGSTVLIVVGALVSLTAMTLMALSYFSGGRLAGSLAARSVPFCTPLLLGLLFTGGAALLFALMPTAFFSSFVSQGDSMRLSQYVGPDFLGAVLDNLSKMRIAVFTADCWRSVLIVAIGTVLLVLFTARKLKALPTVLLLAVLCLADLWMVNKRYLNDAMFQDPEVRTTAHAMKPVNKAILQDKDPDFRVLNFASDTFNENETSYYHKSVGGYHAAKLGRYNELITAYISPEMRSTVEALQTQGLDLDSLAGPELFPVINMLNTKYFIISDEVPLTNPWAQGNAWFVDRLDYVDNANDELSTLGTIDVRHEAVADAQFREALGDAAATDSAATVKLDSYEPNELHYSVQSQTGGVLVFSEIFYPGWTATVDGHDAALGRVNYVLRAMRLQPGSHQVVLTFRPQTVKTTETVAYAATALLVLLVLAAVALGLKKKKP